MSGSQRAPSAAKRLLDQTLGFVAGPRFARRLALSHAIDDIGDAMVNLSLVNSLFLSVSIEASRNRIMLYLLMTAAPLAIAAPLVGNILDRTRIGYGLAISGSQLLRGVVCLALIGSLLSVALYPLTFLVLISRKVYALAKTALISQMAGDSNELLRSDAHIARTGTITSGLGTVAGGVLLVSGYVEAMLIVGAVAFFAAGVISRTIPGPASPISTRSAPRLSEAIPRRVWSAVIACTTIRAAAGALTFLLAFAIKQGGGDEWIFAGGLLAAGIGGFAANVLAGPIHSRLEPDWTLVLALFVPGFVCVIGVITIGNLGVIAIALAIGFGAGVSTRSSLALLATVPSLARGRAIARSELMFQIATLIGAGLAVQLAPTPNVGFGVSSVVLIGAGVVYASRRRRQLRAQAARLLLGEQAPAVDRTLPLALLGEAFRLASLGAYRMAVVVAASAVDVHIDRRPEARQSAPFREWSALADRLSEVRAEDRQPDETLVIDVLERARSLINDDLPARTRSPADLL